MSKWDPKSIHITTLKSTYKSDKNSLIKYRNKYHTLKESPHLYNNISEHASALKAVNKQINFFQSKVQITLIELIRRGTLDYDKFS